jgi:hypothetical protein
MAEAEDKSMADSSPFLSADLSPSMSESRSDSQGNNMPVKTEWIRFGEHLGYLAQPERAATPSISIKAYLAPKERCGKKQTTQQR